MYFNLHITSYVQTDQIIKLKNEKNADTINHSINPYKLS